MSSYYDFFGEKEDGEIVNDTIPINQQQNEDVLEDSTVKENPMVTSKDADSTNKSANISPCSPPKDLHKKISKSSKRSHSRSHPRYHSSEHNHKYIKHNHKYHDNHNYHSRSSSPSQNTQKSIHKLDSIENRNNNSIKRTHYDYKPIHSSQNDEDKTNSSEIPSVLNNYDFLKGLNYVVAESKKSNEDTNRIIIENINERPIVYDIHEQAKEAARIARERAKQLLQKRGLLNDGILYNPSDYQQSTISLQNSSLNNNNSLINNMNNNINKDDKNSINLIESNCVTTDVNNNTTTTTTTTTTNTTSNNNNNVVPSYIGKDHVYEIQDTDIPMEIIKPCIDVDIHSEDSEDSEEETQSKEKNDDEPRIQQNTLNMNSNIQLEPDSQVSTSIPIPKSMQTYQTTVSEGVNNNNHLSTVNTNPYYCYSQWYNYNYYPYVTGYPQGYTTEVQTPINMNTQNTTNQIEPSSITQ